MKSFYIYIIYNSTIFAQKKSKPCIISVVIGISNSCVDNNRSRERCYLLAYALWLGIYEATHDLVYQRKEIWESRRFVLLYIFLNVLLHFESSM